MLAAGAGDLPVPYGLEVDDCSIKRAVAEVLSQPDNLVWFRAATGSVAQSGKAAAEEFLSRASSFDFSPVRFFSPEWFRSRYQVNGPNAFLCYLTDPRQRLASPSPLFAPRWYARRYRLSITTHPLLDYLLHGDARDPHPLIDAAYLKSQDNSRPKGGIVRAFLTDPLRFRLKPNPLFDSAWYLDNNPDVAAAGMNPLEHYLRFGHAEGRNPNRIFNVRWYRKNYLNCRNERGKEPLTAYAVSGFMERKVPAPGLRALSKSSIRMSRHGPKPLLECLESGRSVYASLRHSPDISSEEFREYMLRVQDCNPSMPEHMLFLSKPRVALMYTAKAASATLVYWWLDQAGLLDTALKFSTWSHSFEEIYRSSRANLNEVLMFEPARYHLYKFVRNPLSRAVSSFTQLLWAPEVFGFSPYDKPFSFLEFLDKVQSSHYLNNDFHFRPQQTLLESKGVLRPRILKIEEGMDAHLRNLEISHRLREATYQTRPEIRNIILNHTRQNREDMFVGPDVPVPFYRTPAKRSLLTAEAVERINHIYRADFEAYGYAKQLN